MILPSTTDQTILRVGAACAILGAVISVAAGMGFGNLTNEYGTEEVLRIIAAQPRWYWPTVHLAFIVGAFLWVIAFLALAASLERDWRGMLGSLGAASVIIGAAIHIIDSSISGAGLAALASAWATAPATEQASLVRVGDALLYVLHGTWSSVHSYFHGVPFILSGAAVAVSARYPRWLGWIGVIGGAGILTSGLLMFFGIALGSRRVWVVFAQVVSLWMVAIGVLMWRRARRSPPPSA